MASMVCCIVSHQVMEIKYSRAEKTKKYERCNIDGCNTKYVNRGLH